MIVGIYIGGGFVSEELLLFVERIQPHHDVSFFDPKKRYDLLLVTRDLSFFIYHSFEADKVYIWLDKLNSFFYGGVLPENGDALLENLLVDGLVTSNEDDQKRAEKVFQKSLSFEEFEGFFLEQTPLKEHLLQRKKVFLRANWSNDIRNEWSKMLPDERSFELVDTPEDSVTIGLNLKGNLSLSMEPTVNRGHLPEEGKSLPPNRNGLEWHLSTTRKDLLKEIQKTKLFSAIISSENRLEGHQFRLDLLRALEGHVSLDLYGKHFLPLGNYKGPLAQKDDGIFPYMFHLAIENSRENGYFTEKLSDGILGECVCFYRGAPDILRYVDERAIILLPSDIKECVSLIVSVLVNAEKEYQSRRKYILNEKKRFMNGWNIFPTIERFLQGVDPRDEQCPIKVINLSRRSDRWEKMTTQLLGMTYVRKPAFEGTPEMKECFSDERYLKVKKNPYGGHLDRKGAFGCFFSHLSVWTSLIDPMCLVLEDDAILTDNFALKLKELSRWVSSRDDVHLVFLGYLDDQPIYGDEKVSEVKTGMFSFNIHSMNPVPARAHGGGTHAYLITKAGAEKLEELFEEHGSTDPVDWWLIEMFPFMNAFKCLPHLVEVTGEDTDIQC